VRVECHLIVNSLSSLVNTGCTTSAGSNGEQCGRTVRGIWLSHALTKQSGWYVTETWVGVHAVVLQS
jgi:hypothetical protein